MLASVGARVAIVDGGSGAGTHRCTCARVRATQALAPCHSGPQLGGMRAAPPNGPVLYDWTACNQVGYQQVLCRAMPGCSNHCSEAPTWFVVSKCRSFFSTYVWLLRSRGPQVRWPQQMGRGAGWQHYRAKALENHSSVRGTKMGQARARAEQSRRLSCLTTSPMPPCWSLRSQWENSSRSCSQAATVSHQPMAG